MRKMIVIVSLQLSNQKGLDKAAVEQLIDQLRKQNNTLASNMEQRRNKSMEDAKVLSIFLLSYSFYCKILGSTLSQNSPPELKNYFFRYIL